MTNMRTVMDYTGLYLAGDRTTGEGGKEANLGEKENM